MLPLPVFLFHSKFHDHFSPKVSRLQNITKNMLHYGWYIKYCFVEISFIYMRFFSLLCQHDLQQSCTKCVVFWCLLHFKGVVSCRVMKAFSTIATFDGFMEMITYVYNLHSVCLLDMCIGKVHHLQGVVISYVISDSQADKFVSHFSCSSEPTLVFPKEFSVERLSPSKSEIK